MVYEFMQLVWRNTELARDFTQLVTEFTRLVLLNTETRFNYILSVLKYTQPLRDFTESAMNITQLASDFTQLAAKFTQLADEFTQPGCPYMEMRNSGYGVGCGKTDPCPTPGCTHTGHCQGQQGFQVTGFHVQTKHNHLAGFPRT